MARVNLNKSEELVTNTTAASKCTPKRSRICKKMFFYEVNLTSQCSHLEILLISEFRSETGGDLK